MRVELIARETGCSEHELRDVGWGECMCVGCPERQRGTTAHLTSIPFAHQSKELLRLGSPGDSLQKMLKRFGHFLLEEKHTD